MPNSNLESDESSVDGDIHNLAAGLTGLASSSENSEYSVLYENTSLLSQVRYTKLVSTQWISLQQAWGRLQMDDYDYDYKHFNKGDYDYTKLEKDDYDCSAITVSRL